MSLPSFPEELEFYMVTLKFLWPFPYNNQTKPGTLFQGKGKVRE